MPRRRNVGDEAVLGASEFDPSRSQDQSRAASVLFEEDEEPATVQDFRLRDGRRAEMLRSSDSPESRFVIRTKSFPLNMSRSSKIFTYELFDVTSMSTGKSQTFSATKSSKKTGSRMGCVPNATAADENSRIAVTTTNLSNVSY
jgi:hypothetical protein